jgi:hypothetical protein
MDPNTNTVAQRGTHAISVVKRYCHADTKSAAHAIAVSIVECDPDAQCYAIGNRIRNPIAIPVSELDAKS